MTEDQTLQEPIDARYDSEEAQSAEVKDILLKDIHVDESFNCRGEITRQSVFALMTSIEKDGLLCPIVVREFLSDENTHGFTYDLVAGFRRMRASRMLERLSIHALVRTDTTIDKARVLNLQENLNREQLTLWEEADSLRRLIDYLPDNLTETEICKELTISRGFLQPRLMLTKLPQQVQDLAHGGFLGAQGARDLYKYVDADDPRALAVEIGRLRTQMQNRQAKGQSPKKLKVKKVKKDSGRNPAATAGHKTRKEMNAVIDHLVAGGLAGHFFMKALAWGAGNIDDLEFCAEIRDYGKEVGINFDFDSSGFTDLFNETL